MVVVVVGLIWNNAASLEDRPKVPSSVVVIVAVVVPPPSLPPPTLPRFSPPPKQ